MPPKRPIRRTPRSPFGTSARFKADLSKVKLPAAKATAARLESLALPKELTTALRSEGITSAAKLTMLPAGRKKAIARKAGISLSDMDRFIAASRSNLGSAAVFAANTLAFSFGGVPPWLQPASSNGCGCCPEERSVISRFAYFQYLLGRTGQTIAALDARLFQDFASLAPGTGVTPQAQVAIVVAVLARAYPATLTHAENLPFVWHVLRAALAIAPLTPDAIAAAVAVALPGISASSLAGRLAAWLPGSLSPPSTQFTSAELAGIGDAVEAHFMSGIAAEVDADPAMASANAAERITEIDRRAAAALAPGLREAAILRREAYKARASLSDADLFKRFLIEMDLGPCETTTRLDQAIRSLQAWLDAGISAATTAVARAALAYQPFDVWRAERLGEIHPELAAIFRDDLLTGKGRTATRGSMLVDRDATLRRLRAQLGDVRRAIPHARLATSQDYAAGQPFEGTAYHTHFERGLRVIDQILGADDDIFGAVMHLDSDQPGLGLSALANAEQALEAAGRSIFLDGSPWRSPDQIAHRSLGALAPAERRTKLIVVGSELLLEPKAIFLTDLAALQISGLDVNTGLIDDVSRWQLGNGFRLGNADSERGRLVHDASDNSSSAHSAFYIDGTSFGDYTVSAEVRLTEARWRTSQSDGELVGLVVRRDGNRHYRLVITSEWVTSTTFVGGHSGVKVDINTGNEVVDAVLDFGSAVVEHVTSDPGEAVTTSSMQLVFVLQFVDGGSVTELARDTRPVFFDDGTATFSATVNDNRIEGSVSRGNQMRTLSATHTGTAANRQGTLGVVATETIGAVFGPIRYTLFSESAGQYPPFYAERRAGLAHRHLLDSHTLYSDHITTGAALAVELPTSPLVRDTQALFSQPLAYVKSGGKQVHLLFPGGQKAFVLNALDELLDHCLTFVFHLRFVAIPLRAAQCHLRAGDFDAALAMLRLVYDETAPDEASREVSPCLTDPPAAIGNAIGVDSRLMRLRLAEVHLAKAEWLFRRNGEHDRYHARRHLEQVLALHDRSSACSCGEIYSTLPMRLSGTVAALIRVNGWTAALAGELERRVTGILDALEDARQRVVDEARVAGIAQQLSALPSDTVAALTSALWQVEQQIRALPTSMHSTGSGPPWNWLRVPEATIRMLEFAELIDRPSYRDLLRGTTLSPISVSSLLLGVSAGLCVPQNPMLGAQVRRACVMLDHLRNCRNILGYDERLAPPLRFEALMALARGFADLALAAERDLLGFRQGSEAEAFSLLSAQSQLASADATVQLEEMKVQQAMGDVQGAALQAGQAAFAADHYSDLLATGLNDWEKLALGAAWTSVGLSLASMLPAAASMAVAGVGVGVAATGVGAAPGAGMALIGALGTLATATTGGVGSAGSAASSVSQVATMMASYERRAQEWEFQLGMASHSSAIAGHALSQAIGRAAIAREERSIAELQRSLAARGVDFLSNKFLNREMYIWMLRVAREQYRTRLNYAIEASYMAERALALELQQDIDAIRFDYFDPRRDGLLGAVQLQTDLATLEHRRLTQRQRDLQLSKTISMALSMPGDLQRFRAGSGVLPFSTRQEWFDRDFPGHYLRLIKSVKVTVVALVPPLDGIHGTLTHSGISSTIIGPPFRRQVIQRRPESIAISAPYQATGVFVLDYHAEFLLPFEGSGVESDWLFELPKATNAFDYATIADVLVTIDYTARSSQAYRHSVQQRLGSQIRGERPFVFAQELPDQWYELHNPTQSGTPMQVTFTSRPADYPANLTKTVIEHVTLLMAAPQGGTPVSLAGISFTLDYLDLAGVQQSVTATADAVNGVVTTRRPAIGNPLSPLRGKPTLGTWTLAFPDTSASRALFATSAVSDLLLIVSYTAQNASWS